jgi:hypothetical protein
MEVLESSEKTDFHLAEMIQARINTRETSTLTIATVAASASLVLLALAANPESSFAYTHHAWLRFAGFLFALLGIIYRELTILTADAADYSRLRELCPDLGSIRSGRFWRAFMLRALLLSTLAAWSNLLFNSLAEIGAMLRISDNLSSVFPFLYWLVFLPMLLYGQKKQKLAAAVTALIAAAIAGWLTLYPGIKLSVETFALTGGIYAGLASLVLTTFDSKSESEQ